MFFRLLHSRVRAGNAAGFVNSCRSVQNEVERLIFSLASFVHYTVGAIAGQQLIRKPPFMGTWEQGGVTAVRPKRTVENI